MTERKWEGKEKIEGKNIHVHETKPCDLELMLFLTMTGL